MAFFRVSSGGSGTVSKTYPINIRVYPHTNGTVDVQSYVNGVRTYSKTLTQDVYTAINVSYNYTFTANYP